MNVSDLYIWHNQFSIRLQGPTLYSSIAAVYYTVPHTRIYCCANVLVLVVRHALCPLIVHKLSVHALYIYLRHGVFHGNNFSAPKFVSMEVEERDALRALGVGT